MAVFSRLLALSLFPFVLNAICIFANLHTDRQLSPRIPVDPSYPRFNSSKDPHVIAHLTDLHISNLRLTTSVARFRESLEFIHSTLNATVALLTGDLTDNLNGTTGADPAYPIEAHWKLYSELVRNSSLENDKIVEVLGNHDTWGIFDSEGQYFFRYMLHPPINNWFSQSFEFGSVRVVTFTPIRFPSGRGLYNLMVTLCPEMIEAVEEELEKETKCDVTVVGGHFPTGMMWPISVVRSRKTNRTLVEVLSDPKYRVFAYLNGHTHPKEIQSLHIGSILDLTGPPLLRQDGILVLTVDNGRIGYGVLHVNDTRPAVVTSPASDRLTTRVFVDKEFDIRVLSFSSNATKFHVSGAVNGDLSFQRQTDSGASLYALEVSLPTGRHTITISGDLNTTITFSVGVSVEPFIESQLTDFRGWAIFLFFHIGLAVNILIAVTICSGSPSSSHFTCTTDSLRAGNVPPLASLCVSVIGWPFFMGHTVRRLPQFARRFAVFTLLAPFILPMAITRIGGYLSIQTPYGQLTKGIFRYDVVAQLWAYFYNGGFATIIIIFMCLTSCPFSWSMLVDGAISLCQTAVAVRYWEAWGRESVMRGTIFTISPLFHAIPIAAIVVLVALASFRKAKAD
jgi:hypothetical protein